MGNSEARRDLVVRRRRQEGVEDHLHRRRLRASREVCGGGERVCLDADEAGAGEQPGEGDYRQSGGEELEVRDVEPFQARLVGDRDGEPVAVEPAAQAGAGRALERGVGAYAMTRRGGRGRDGRKCGEHGCARHVHDERQPAL